eukprot:GHVU01004330.1.p2 GENE.GHVU01004330.1~~GHVU01004330.1.p2  ORF type:complete len:116 (-),score=1.85 GHVU01004330.1:686-1033(-)
MRIVYSSVEMRMCIKPSVPVWMLSGNHGSSSDFAVLTGELLISHLLLLLIYITINSILYYSSMRLMWEGWRVTPTSQPPLQRRIYPFPQLFVSSSALHEHRAHTQYSRMTDPGTT